jgi:hypothetical protein
MAPTMILDNKLLNLAARLHELKEERENLDNEIAKCASELVAYCRGIDGSGGQLRLTTTNGTNGANAAIRLPPSDSLQGKVLTWLRAQEAARASGSIATAMNHPAKAIRSTLRAMQTKHLVRKAGRDLWNATA